MPQDEAEAVYWYRLAADQGLAGAQFNLGVMYSEGQGVPQNDAEAVRWHRLAAQAGPGAGVPYMGQTVWYRQDEKGPRGKVKRDPLSHTGDRVPGTSRKRRDTVVWHDSSQEDPEVIRMSQWAEIRQMHVVDGVPKKQIAERLGVEIKTVRRAVAQATAPARRAVSRPRHLDRWRAQIEQWLRQDRRLTATRIRRLRLPLAGPVAERTVRGYVARLKTAAAPKEVSVHRSPRPGVTLEVDFGESWAEVAGVLRKVTYVVATLPYSNVYFATAYPLERLESLWDGMQAACASMGGVTDRVVLDNTTIAVKQVLTGRDRVQTDAFQAFRGAYPFAAAFCAPAKGWEKGSVETGVKYVRNLVFRPRPTVATWAALNALILTELEADCGDPPARRRAPGAGSVDAGAAAPAGPARPPPRDLPRRGAGGRQVRARPGGPGDLLGADPRRRPACVGDAVPRPRGGCRRHRGRRPTRPGVSCRGDGARSAPRAAGAGTHGCFRHQLLLPRPYLVLTKPLRLDIQCQRGASVKIGWEYLDD